MPLKGHRERKQICSACNVPASGGNGPDGIVAAFYHSQDIRICGFCIPGIYGHRDHKCGERAGEGTAGDREG